MKKYAFGVDVGGTTVKMGFFTTAGELLEKWEIPTRTQDEGAHVLPDIAEAVSGKLKEKGIDKHDVEGIGIGVPGPVCDHGVVYKCVNLGWGVFNVEYALGHMTGLKVKAGNDANVAALGEMWKGGGRGHRSIIMITLGTGVGGGIIINEKILAGTNGAAGEIGHMPVKEDETDTCGCGKKGCLEQYASATGIVRMTKKYLAEHPDEASVLAGNITAKDIFDAAKAGDPVALKMVDELGRMLGTAAASLACAVNPEAFVIGGGVARAGAILMDAVEKYFHKNAFHASANTRFIPAELGNDAGIYGGVKMVI